MMPSNIGEFQVSILETVSKLREQAYGMKIRDALSEELGREIHMPQVYAALSRLVKLGLLSSGLDKKQSAGQRGRTRRIYDLSAQGLQILSDGVRYSRGAREKGLFIYEKDEKAPAA
jgi:DNA-binding PadR family transcriptional regulator